MNLPTIMRTTQESLKTVPQSYREGAFGPGRGQVAHDPHGGAARLRGRRCHRLHSGRGPHSGRDRRRCCSPPASPTTLNGFFERTAQSAGATLTVALYVYAKEQGEFGVAFAIAAILMVLTLLINLAADLVGAYTLKKRLKLFMKRKGWKPHEQYHHCQGSVPVVRQTIRR